MAKTLSVEIVGNSRDLERAFGKAAGATSGFGSKMATVGRMAGVAFAALGAGAVFAGEKMISMASDAAEVDSKMQVVFGKALPGLTKNLDTFSKATGASRFALREQAADMGALLEPLTATKKGAADMSEKFVKLATDLGSFNNVPVADALLAIRSGLVGEAEPLRRFGVLLNAAAVEAEGLRLGLVKQGDAMTEQQKVQARASLIMQQTTLAQGDATRTAGSMANQMKTLRNNVSDAATSIGTLLIPYALAAVKAFNEHWPTIEKVARAAFGGAIVGIQAFVSFISAHVVPAIATVVGFIRTHWGTISEVFTRVAGVVGGVVSGMVATIRQHLGTIKAVASSLVSFFRSDFGQGIAGAAVGVLALVTAAKGIYAAFLAARTAILAFTAASIAFAANPILLGIGLIGAAVGAILVPKLLEGMGGLRSFAAAAEHARGVLDSLQGSIDRLRGAHLSNAEAQARVIASEHAVSAARENSIATVKRYGAGSLEAKQASDAYTSAVLGRQRAELDLTETNAALGEEQRKRAAELSGPVADAFRKIQGEGAKVTAELAKFHGPLKQIGEAKLAPKLIEYANTMRAFGVESQAAAAKLTTVDPAAARASRQAAILAVTAADLALKLGRVPTNKEIVAAAKITGLAGFTKGLEDMPKLASAAAKKTKGAIEGEGPGTEAAGAKVGEKGASGVGKGAAKMGEKARTQAAKIGPIVGSFQGAVYSGGLATGISAGQGVEQGIRNQIPSIRAAAAAASAASVISMQRALRTGSRSKETYEKAGIPAGQGLIEGITDYLKANGTKVEEATKQATNIAAQVMPSIEAAGRVLGLAKARAIAMGVIQGAPGLAQQMKQAVSQAASEAIKAAAEKVRETKDAFSSAFGDLASAALSAFDSQVAKWESPARKLLEKLRMKETAQQLNKTIGSSQKALTEAEAAFAKAQAAEGAPIAEGADPVAEMAQRAEAVKQAGAQVLAAEEALLQAQRAKRDFHLEQRAVKEEAAHTKITEKRRVQFESQLAQAQNWLAKHPEKYAEGQRRILAVLDRFIPGFKLSGEAIGAAFAQGIESAIGAVERASAKLAKAAEKYLKLKSPAEAGPLASVNTWWKGLPAALMSSVDTSALNKALGSMVSPVAMPAMAGAGAGARGMGGMAMAGGGGGPITVNVYPQNMVSTKADLAKQVKDELIRMGFNNGGGMLRGQG